MDTCADKEQAGNRKLKGAGRNPGLSAPQNPTKPYKTLPGINVQPKKLEFHIHNYILYKKLGDKVLVRF